MLKGDSTYVLYKDNIRRTFMKCHTFYIDLDNDLYEVYIKNHEPIIHNKISNYEKWLDRLGNELGGKKT